MVELGICYADNDIGVFFGYISVRNLNSNISINCSNVTIFGILIACKPNFIIKLGRNRNINIRWIATILMIRHLIF